ncbi:MAG: HD domain-containing protein [Clostridia bacterium]|nr:HD domain-containing protein [Clostridia bacterium]
MLNKLPRIDIIKLILAFSLLIVLLYQYFIVKSILNLSIVCLYLVTVLLYEFVSKKRRQLALLHTSDCKGNAMDEAAVVSQRVNNKTVVEEKHDGILVKLKLKEDELEALRATSEILTSSLDINTIIEYIYEVFKKFTGCDRSLISFVDKETSELICKYELGDTLLNEVGKVFCEDSAVKKCFESKEVISIQNVEIKTRCVIGDKAAIPLNLSNELVGVIFIESSIPGTFSEINKSFLESLANYAAVAIKNAELFNNIYYQKQEIEALYEETAAVNEELNSYIEDLNKTKEELKIKNNELTNFYNNIQTGYLQTVMSLANAIEAKDAYTRGHCQRVMEISCEIATRMGMDEEGIKDLRYSAILHDIGKIGISANILNKEGKLTDEEYNEIKRHPSISHNILRDVEFIRKGLEGVLQHHERYDGRGYPYGIKGKDIHIFGRILCVADAFDAMTSDRPYRKGMPMEEALKEIERCKGTQFDPEISDLFIAMCKAVIDAGEQI